MNAAQLARALELSHVAVANYLAGRIPHGEILVAIAKYFGVTADSMISGDEEAFKAPRGETLQDADLESTKNKLSELRRDDPEAFKTVRDVIGTYHRSSAKPKRKVSSKLTSEEESLLDAAEAVADREIAEHERAKSSPKSATGAPSVQKRAPSRSASKVSKGTPSPPGQVPKQ